MGSGEVAAGCALRCELKGAEKSAVWVAARAAARVYLV